MAHNYIHTFLLLPTYLYYLRYCLVPFFALGNGGLPDLAAAAPSISLYL